MPCGGPPKRTRVANAYEVIVIPAPSDSVDPGDPPRFDAGTRDEDAGAPDEPGPVDAGPPDAGLD